MNFDNYKFRCSSLGKLMVEPRGKSEGLSETTKGYLMEIFIAEKYGRVKDFDSKYTTKGLMVEEDSLTLYSQYKKTMFVKNDERRENLFISGHPDIVTEHIIDIKSSWDIFTFHKSKNLKEMHKDYYWQLQGYMELFDIESARLVYCLVNTPDQIIHDEFRRLQWKMNVIDENDSLYIEACGELQKLMVYNDIPLKEKVFELELWRDPDQFAMLYDKIELSKAYLNKLAHGTT